MKIVTHPSCTAYEQPGHPERPERVSQSVQLLRTQKELALSWGESPLATDDMIQCAHDAALLWRLVAPADFDADTPAHPEIVIHAQRAAGAALECLWTAWRGEPAFSLMRPPGHHATANRAMGFCYLNNMAIAVRQAHRMGVARVAVLDFDVHHGNGTESILLSQSGCAYFSVHESPAYPGTGTASYLNAHNYCVPPHAPRLEYRALWKTLLHDVQRFQPELIAVSAGFDTYKNDPLGRQKLEQEDYAWLGDTIRRLDLPTFGVLEGGYSEDLPELILAFLQGWSH